MRFWTVHLHPGAEPVLVPESFSPAALLFGPFWLLAHRAWIAGLLVLVAMLVPPFLAPWPFAPAVELAIMLGLGLHGHDLRRWALSRRGFLLAHVVAARSHPEAWIRLLAQRPDLAGRITVS